MTKYREILRLQSLDSANGTSHRAAVYPEHSRQGFEKGSGNKYFMAAGF